MLRAEKREGIENERVIKEDCYTLKTIYHKYT